MLLSVSQSHRQVPISAVIHVTQRKLLGWEEGMEGVGVRGEGGGVTGAAAAAKLCSQPQ